MLNTATADVRTLAHADQLSRAVWADWGAGKLTDAEAENLAARIEDRRREIRPNDRTAVRAPHVPRVRASFFPPKRRKSVSPDRRASMERRRFLAASGPMPPALACHFTTGQLAALRIVTDEVRANQSCTLTIGEIAARAGVGMTTARDAIRAAAFDGLVVIEERRQHHAPNLPNRVRVISREWLSWIRRGNRGGGFKLTESTDNRILKPSVENAKCGQKAGSAGLSPRFGDPRRWKTRE